MTKLEEKLIELGYKRSEFMIHSFKKIFIDNVIMFILNEAENNIKERRVMAISIKSQQDINDLQQAFNQLQKDLDVLKNDEKN